MRGKLVLCDATPSACHRQAVEEHGAAGLVSYNSNQVSAWWRDDQDLIRWGHLDSRGRRNTFAIMISVREARALQQRLASGERITLHAVVKARNDDSMPYETLVATIPGTDSAAGDIVFSCHLDHEKPGANDNASGCAANLEIARALKRSDRREADSAAGADDPLHLAVGDDRDDRLPLEVSRDRVAHSRRRAPGHGRRRSVRHQVGAARHALAVVDRHGHRRCRRRRSGAT